MKHTVWAFVFLSIVSSCARPRQPDLMPRLIVESEKVGRDFWLGAPYIAAVKIIHADLQGGRRAVFPGGAELLQLVKFDAHVENTILGEFQSETISFYFFAFLGQKQVYYLTPGKRYIVSLRSEGGVFRSWSDATQLNIEVYSGSHNQQDLPLALGPAAAISYILLTPGADLDTDKFEHHLGDAWVPSNGSPGYVYQRLQVLQQNPDPTIRDSACVAAAYMFAQRPKCLEQAAHSVDAFSRHTASEFLESKDASVSMQLRSAPLSVLPEPWTEYLPQMLEIYADDTRPEVRTAACASLKKFAPQHKIENCR